MNIKSLISRRHMDSCKSSTREACYLGLGDMLGYQNWGILGRSERSKGDCLKRNGHTVLTSDLHTHCTYMHIYTHPHTYTNTHFLKI